MKRLLAAALLVAGATACGGGGNPKQFVVAFNNQRIVAGANADCPLVPDSRVTEKPFLNDGTYTVYQGDSTHYYLDLGGGTVFEGQLANGTYTFSAQTSDDLISPDLSNRMTEQKTLNNSTVTFKVDGKDVTGSINQELQVNCANLNGQPDTCKTFGQPRFSYGGQSFSSDTGNTVDCIITADLQGVVLEDPTFTKATSTPGAGGSSTNQ